MKAKNIMIQGTASSVGKSLIAAGLCRIFREDGYRVAPFKSQNMALNSFITADGLEMGRAQAVQAEAAGIEPDVRMNPILLKPTTDKKAQVIIKGKVYGNMSAAEYHEFKPELKETVREAYEELASENDIIVIEGAGSPAEINLTDRDIVNMGMAEIAKAPVLLAGDIDRGGVFASLAGTMLLLPEKEAKRVKGVIINKFRGDIKILEPGIKMIEDIIHIPVIGVVPYAKLAIDDEDSVSEKLYSKTGKNNFDIDIAVVHLPHISNYTDFNALENIEGVIVRYVKDPKDIGNPDLIILPGTKNTIGDLLHLRACGMEKAVIDLYKKGVPVFGICGGYQMMGNEIRDPHSVESEFEKAAGMGLLDAVTVMQKEKRTLQAEAEVCANQGILEGTLRMKVKGYEIHMGLTQLSGNCMPFSMVSGGPANGLTQADGACDREGRAIGTYIHGIFDNSGFALRIVNNLRKRKGLNEMETRDADFRSFKQKEYDRLAKLIRDSVDIGKVYEIMNSWEE